jgi:8-oxo-dGTP pyrophosphatase MutT (NUDIX family)
MTEPAWLQAIREVLPTLSSEVLGRWQPPTDFDGRESAVLLLFGDDDGVPELVVIQRSQNLKHHPGQPAFPGGGMDPHETPAMAALREAQEEIGLDPSTVVVLGQLPRILVPVSGYAVTPVVAYWQTPHSVGVIDTNEVQRVERISLAELTDPNNRVSVRHSSGYVGPAFLVRELTVWGFTGALLDRVLELFGFAQPWDTTNIIDLAPAES